MGLYPSCHIGPVLLAKQKPGEEATTFRACSNTSCDLYRKEGKVKGNNCHQCGSVIKGYKGKPRRVDKPTLDDVWSALSEAGLNTEALWENDFCESPRKGWVVWFPNNYLGQNPPRDHRPDNPEKCTILLEDIDSAADIEWFESVYDEYITVMKGLYEDAEVAWGIFYYQS